jgi:hypothetical protein
MDPLPSDSEPPIWKARLAGIILALAVFTPALYVPGFLGHPQSVGGWVSWWIILPALGAAWSTQLILANVGISKRVRAGLLGCAAGCCCYLAASFWSAFSPHTSRIEILVVTPLGGIPILILGKLWFRRRNPVASQAASRNAWKVWLNFLSAQKAYPPVLFVIFLVGFAVLTFRSLSLLNRLGEQAIPPTYRSPVLSFYDRFGYWPAALLTPGFGLMLISFCAWINYRKQTNTL